jgi:phage terminase large subunit-like protein
VITTTPRPIPLLQAPCGRPGHGQSHAPTARNAYNLAPGFSLAVVSRYAGTRLGRQELDGEFIEERPDALFPRALIEAARGLRPRRSPASSWRSIRRLAASAQGAAASSSPAAAPMACLMCLPMLRLMACGPMSGRRGAGRLSPL